MGKPQGNVIYRNLANATSILGVLPLVLLFLDDGYRYLIPLIIFNNVMDDLDGILATRLNIRSRFGGDLDNVCDAVAHTILVLAVGAHFGELVLLGLPFTHKPQQDNITHLRSVSTRHSYAEMRYSPAIVIGVPGADHFSAPDSPLLRRPEALHHRVALAASTLFFSVGAQGS